MWPHRRQPTRLPRPWDSPGKNTGVGCHFLLQGMKVKSESEVAQLCPTLSYPMDCSLPGSFVHGIFQARVLEWGAIAFSINSCIAFLNGQRLFFHVHELIWSPLQDSSANWDFQSWDQSERSKPVQLVSLVLTWRGAPNFSQLSAVTPTHIWWWPLSKEKKKKQMWSRMQRNWRLCMVGGDAK